MVANYGHSERITPISNRLDLKLFVQSADYFEQVSDLDGAFLFGRAARPTSSEVLGVLPVCLQIPILSLAMEVELRRGGRATVVSMRQGTSGPRLTARPACWWDTSCLSRTSAS